MDAIKEITPRNQHERRKQAQELREKRSDAKSRGRPHKGQDAKDSIVDDLMSVAKDVSRVSGIHTDMLLGRGRMEPVAYARFMIYTIMYQRGWSTTAIGAAFPCKRDHGTILHGLNVVRYKRDYLPGMNKLIDELEEIGYSIRAEKEVAA